MKIGNDSFEIVHDTVNYPAGFILTKNGEPLWYIAPRKLDSKDQLCIYTAGPSIENRPDMTYDHIYNGGCYLIQSGSKEQMKQY